MNYIERNKDIVSGNQDLELLYAFKKFPVFMGCTEQSKDLDVFADMNWHISRSSGMIQLNPLLPLDVVYQAEHNSGAVGKAWMQHHSTFADFLLKFSPKSIYEIGGSHGFLANFAKEKKSNLDWTIIEPNPVYQEHINANVIKAFFTKDTVLPAQVDTIVHSHVLEHVYSPQDFFAALEDRPIGTKVIFSVPSLQMHLKQLFVNILNFEHTYLCSEPYIEWWFATHGYKMLERVHNADFAIFYAFVKNNIRQDLDYPKLYNENKKLFVDYVTHHQNQIVDINHAIEKHQGNVFLFGAHVISQFLIAFGLDTQRIKCVLDNSLLKQGKRLYGTDLTVNSPKVLVGEKNPLVIIKTGVFNKEIMDDILININSSTTFVD